MKTNVATVNVTVYHYAYVICLIYNLLDIQTDK